MDDLELIVLVGIQAAGKTTFYRRELAGRYLHVSLDNWRGKDNVRAREQRAILEGLAAAADSDGRLGGVVVDNTNTTVQTRRRYFQYASESSRQTGRAVSLIAYWFDEDLKSCLARNQQRPKDAPVGSGYHVPPAAIAGFHARLEPPTAAEGFARVVRVHIAPDDQPQGPPAP